MHQKIPSDLIPFPVIQAALDSLPVKVRLSESDLVKIGYRPKTPCPFIRKSRKHGSPAYFYRRSVADWFGKEFKRLPELVATFHAALTP